MTKRITDAQRKADERAQAIVTRNAKTRASTNIAGFWTGAYRNQACTAYSKGRRMVTLGGKKFKMFRSKNPIYIIVTPADGSVVPMACLERR